MYTRRLRSNNYHGVCEYGIRNAVWVCEDEPVRSGGKEVSCMRTVIIPLQ